MALEKVFREFAVRLLRLRDRVQELRLTVVEDRPPKRDAVVVDDFEYAVEDILGWLAEAIDGSGKAAKAAGHPVNIDAARRSLTSCQEKVRQIEKCFAAKLASYEKVSDLTKFGAERRGEWPSWVSSVRQGIEQCRQPLEDAGGGLAECWQEIAERAGMTSVTVSTTAIGQKIVSTDGNQNPFHRKSIANDADGWRQTRAT
jgi:hypothetical protein